MTEVGPFNPDDVPGSLKRLRARLGLSQTAFAKRYSLVVKTLQKWERGECYPDNSALSYLLVIDQIPGLVASVFTDV